MTSASDLATSLNTSSWVLGDVEHILFTRHTDTRTHTQRCMCNALSLCPTLGHTYVHITPHNTPTIYTTTLTTFALFIDPVFSHTSVCYIYRYYYVFLLLLAFGATLDLLVGVHSISEWLVIDMRPTHTWIDTPKLFPSSIFGIDTVIHTLIYRSMGHRQRMVTTWTGTHTR